MPSVKPTRPDFATPPIVEQAITVNFDPIPSCSLVHFGQFFGDVSAEFPEHSHDIRLDAPIENAALESSPEIGIRLVQMGSHLPRLLLRNATELIQLQNDRFSFNWCRSPIGSEYPRWETTFSRFKDTLERFERFLNVANLTPLALRQCEVTNVNIVPVSTFGNSFDDIKKAFVVDPLDFHVPCLVPETYVRARQHRIINSEGGMRGRLHTLLQPAYSASDGSAAFKLDFTARSLPNLTTKAEVTEFFSIARDSINAAFMATTTPEMHKIWGEKE
jgi:uncharacterized protein (TIGR04255 family)